MFAKSFVALAVAAASVLGQQINTPASLTVCQPTLLSWSGGQAPYFLSVIPGGQASAAALKDFGEQNDNSETWTVDLAAGTSITLKLTDSTGNTVYSSPVTIGEGTSTSCLNAAGSSSAASGASSAAASSTGTAAGASSVVSSAASSASSAASSAVSSASSAAASATSARASTAAGSSAASSVRSAASSAASGASSAASSAAAAATSPASGASKLVVSGLGAIVLSAVGVALA